MDRHFNQTYVLLFLAAVLWGGQPTILKGLIKELSPIIITFYRYAGISAILLIVLFLIHGKIVLPRGRQIVLFVAMGLSGITLNNIFQFTGLQYSTAINCSLVSSTTPALTAALAALFLREKMTAVQWIGIFISFLGIVFLLTHGSIEAIMTLTFNYGDILYFASQICWAAYSIMGRRVMVEFSPMAATAWAGLAGAVLTGVYALWCGIDLLPGVTAGGAVSMAYMTIGGGVLAMTWWNNGVKVVGPSRASIFFNIVPIAGMIFGVVFLGEPLGKNELLAGAAILSDVYLSTPEYKYFQK